MEPAKKFEKILESALTLMTRRLSIVIGEPLVLLRQRGSYVTGKELVRESQIGRVVVDVDLIGEAVLKGSLFVSRKDAIRLGGLLIMLPEPELIKITDDEDYEKDIQYAFSEITHIVGEVFTEVLQDSYLQPSRFVCRNQDLVDELKIDEIKKQILPDQNYYQVNAEMILMGKVMDPLVFIFPATFLEPVIQDIGDETPDRAKDNTRGDGKDKIHVDSKKSENEKSLLMPVDIKYLKKIERLQDDIIEHSSQELQTLLGVDLTWEEQKIFRVTKEVFVVNREITRQVMACLAISGEIEDDVYVFAEFKDGIRLAGTLLNTPPQELEAVVEREEFNSDYQDGFSEIINMLVGILNVLFEDTYNKNIRFHKKQTRYIYQSSVEIADQEPTEDISCYLFSLKLRMNNNSSCCLQLILPEKVVENVVLTSRIKDPVKETAIVSELEDPIKITPKENPDVKRKSDSVPVLIISDYEPDASAIRKVLEGRKLGWQQCSFGDDIKGFLPGKFELIFLISQDLDEQVFGVVIKISSSCSLPLILASSQWTQSKVSMAIRYGVSDILLTPSTDEDILEKIQIIA